MILEHGLSGLCAQWDTESNKWDIGQNKVYRWLTPDNTPASKWLNSMQEVITWIIDYDSEKYPEYGIQK